MIFAVVGPSGAGKDTLLSGALAARPDLHLVRRVITRPSEAGGEDFEGVTEAEFQTRLAKDAFALTWDAHGLRYGIPRDQITGLNDVVFNGSRAALLQAVSVFPNLRVILVTAPDAVLAARLAARGRETVCDIAARLSRAAFTLPHGIAATTVVNDATPAEGIARLLAALQPVSA
ncbi:MAG: phosphonate metabolism protein/1,5-bisphosphokinase (PRPP-forming) PhnN [Tabrizicola sp.]|uniref:phosphonate metabolism protein/1,5-bisphosphokinase (PRPP-forming) PhnN n=1 Tax=Tabrizicola sp. TaxID=2005166 RepID=UPI0027349371|nr:phosphonate metabolism protein/1,5-bisphosphokinase (PRPP-forming) PhnN [Tabrizicola sp.]MDP3263947.1 phosphonate metabolism protein/1,5-bisphosphokinase (PRPP-forming) PhnN [Tabrizicola sp.]MDP3647312.1 phosphonate metabolism protein/1,5-bisphosphokinase (PRPP-forming) PhnN [Paracoccaceae bacterium]MDZ4069788.1 phosphonate metabolism protein/1,5-bisphosphokinase (PRPP-forming) PhnN [Tabrizicola sp.]